MDNTNAVEEQQSESSSPTQETKCCEVCGDIGDESLLMKCSQCNETREHTYCAQVLLSEVPSIWICEECRNSSRVLRVPPSASIRPPVPPAGAMNQPVAPSAMNQPISPVPVRSNVRNEHRRGPVRPSVWYQPRRSAGLVRHETLYVPRSPGPHVRNALRRSAVPVPPPETESESESGSEEEDRSSFEVSDAISFVVVDTSNRELVDDTKSNSVPPGAWIRPPVPPADAMNQPVAPSAMNQPRSPVPVRYNVRNEHRRSLVPVPTGVWNQPRITAGLVRHETLYVPRSPDPPVRNERRRSAVPVPVPVPPPETESGSEEEDRSSFETSDAISFIVVDTSNRELVDDAKSNPVAGDEGKKKKD